MDVEGNLLAALVELRRGAARFEASFSGRIVGFHEGE
jgi:hypothetical protein